VYQLTYRFGRLQSGWQIYDILAEGISMVANYRQQIDDHFRNDNAQALVKKLDELLND
jgi:phospholipid transport system substrate-binding protein